MGQLKSGEKNVSQVFDVIFVWVCDKVTDARPSGPPLNVWRAKVPLRGDRYAGFLSGNENDLAVGTGFHDRFVRVCRVG